MTTLRHFLAQAMWNHISKGRTDLISLSVLLQMTMVGQRNVSRRNKAMVLLPQDFQPSPYSVICGREKYFRDSIGNRRLKVTLSLFLPKYSSTRRKDVKSSIVSTIIDIIRDACPQGEGAFIKLVEGRWWEVDDATAREKVGAALRDCLHEKYRSSSRSKSIHRKRLRRVGAAGEVKSGCTKSTRTPRTKRGEGYRIPAIPISKDLDECLNQLPFLEDDCDSVFAAKADLATSLSNIDFLSTTSCIAFWDDTSLC